MAGLVPRHVGEHPLEERLLGLVAHVAEDEECEPLGDHLHADGLEEPAVGLEHVVEQLLEPGRDGVDLVELADVRREGLDVARLVHRLGGGVELAIHVRDGVHELGRHHERALLAVQEVREQEGRAAARDLPLGLGVEGLPVGGLLAIEGVRIEGAELVDLALVVPVVDRLHGGPDPVGLLRVGFRERGTGSGRHGGLRGGERTHCGCASPQRHPLRHSRLLRSTAVGGSARASWNRSRISGLMFRCKRTSA